MHLSVLKKNIFSLLSLLFMGLFFSGCWLHSHPVCDERTAFNVVGLPGVYTGINLKDPKDVFLLTIDNPKATGVHDISIRVEGSANDSTKRREIATCQSGGHLFLEYRVYNLNKDAFFEHEFYLSEMSFDKKFGKLGFVLHAYTPESLQREGIPFTEFPEIGFGSLEVQNHNIPLEKLIKAALPVKGGQYEFNKIK